MDADDTWSPAGSDVRQREPCTIFLLAASDVHVFDNVPASVVALMGIWCAIRFVAQVVPCLCLRPIRTDKWLAHRGQCGLYFCILVGLLNTSGKCDMLRDHVQLAVSLANTLYPETSVDEELPALDTTAVAAALTARSSVPPSKPVLSADSVFRICALLKDLLEPELYNPAADHDTVISGLLAARDCFVYQERGNKRKPPIGRVSLAWRCLQTFYASGEGFSLRKITVAILQRMHEVRYFVEAVDAVGDLSIACSSLFWTRVPCHGVGILLSAQGPGSKQENREEDTASPWDHLARVK